MLLKNVSGGTIVVRKANQNISVGDGLAINLVEMEARSLLNISPEDWEEVNVVDTIVDLSSFTTDDLAEGTTNLYMKGSYAIIEAGTHTTVGGGATETVSLAGVLATDLVFCQAVDLGTAEEPILTAVAGTDEFEVEFAGDPGNDQVFAYQVLRAI